MEFRSISDLEARLSELTEAVPAELTAWQLEDMHRRAPHTEVDGNTAFTLIQPPPRSKRKPKPEPRSFYLRRGRAPKPKPEEEPPKPRTSKRPILRPELLNKLRARMQVLLARTVTPWA